MGAESKIEWTDATFNPWWGCTKVSPGCDHCYAESLSKRYGHDVWGVGKRRRTFGDKHWAEPYKWNAKARDAGKRLRVFCASMADVFDNEAPDEWRARLFDMIEDTEHLDWLLLTKRIGNVAKMAPDHWTRAWPWHVWLGASFVNQEEYDRDRMKLLAVGAAITFTSFEPLLGPIILDKYAPVWIIVGGESGPGARHMDPQWARDIRDQSKRLGRKFFMKQMAKKALIPDDLMVRDIPFRGSES